MKRVCLLVMISPAYLVYFKSKNQIKRVRCVKFFDNVVQKTEACTNEPVQNVDQNIVKSYMSVNTLVEQARGNDQNNADQSISDDDATITCRESARKLVKPVYLKDYVTMADAPTDQNIDYLYQMGNLETPKTFKEVIQSEKSMKWHQAMMKLAHLMKMKLSSTQNYLPEQI